MWRKYFLAVLFFLLPLIFHGQFQMTYRPYVFSQIAVIFISLTLLVVVLEMPLTVRLFYIWCIATTFTSRMPQFSAIALIIVTLLVLLFRMIAHMKSEDLNFCFRYVAIGACIQVFWVFAQSVNRDFIMNLPRDVNFIFGTLGNKNLLGALFLMAIIPMYFYKRWTVALPILGILYSKASSSIFALGGGILFYIIFINFRKHPRQKFSQHFTKALIILSLVMSMMLLWQYVDNPVIGFQAGRWPIWKKVMTLMFERRVVDVEDLLKDGKKKVMDRFDGQLKEIDAKKTGWLYTKRQKEKEISVIKDKIAALKKVEGLTIKKAGKVWDIPFIETLRNPWLGYGLGTFKFEFPKRLTVEEAGGAMVDRKGQLIHNSKGESIPIRWRRAHNTYLQTGREQGLIGMFFLLLIPGILFAKFIRGKKTEKSVLWMSAIAMICLNAIGNFPDRNFTLMYYMLFLFAIYKVEVLNEQGILGVDRVTRFAGYLFDRRKQWFISEIRLITRGRCFSFQRR